MVNYYMHDKLCNGITYLFPNFNGADAEVWEWMNNLISHFAGHMITWSMSIQVNPY